MNIDAQLAYFIGTVVVVIVVTVTAYLKQRAQNEAIKRDISTLTTTTETIKNQLSDEYEVKRLRRERLEEFVECLYKIDTWLGRNMHATSEAIPDTNPPGLTRSQSLQELYFRGLKDPMLDLRQSIIGLNQKKLAEYERLVFEKKFMDQTTFFEDECWECIQKLDVVRDLSIDLYGKELSPK